MREKEQIFCEEFLIDLNASAAALRAGYSPAYAKDASKWIHPEHPEKPKLRAEIDRLMALRSRRTGVSADRIVVELGKIAFANIGDVVDTKTGKVLPGALPENLAAIAGLRIKSGKISEHEVHLCDKLRAVELLMRHLGMLDDRQRREDNAQGSVQKVAELMDRLDAESEVGNGGGETTPHPTACGGHLPLEGKAGVGEDAE